MSGFEFQLEEDGSLSLESAVFQAIGAGSSCWDNLEGAGVFQSERAQEIGEALIDAIKSERFAFDGMYDNEYYDPDYCEQCNDYHDYDNYDAIYSDYEDLADKAENGELPPIPGTTVRHDSDN